jgi:mono/diheme cytochrome c family protein
MTIRSVSAGMLVAFAALAAAAAFAQPTSAEDGTPLGDAANGGKLYVDRACWQCHGLAAQGGGAAGPRLAGRVVAWAAFSSYVRRPTEEMIPYTAQVLPDAELADIFEFLRTLPPPPDVASLPLLSPER